LTDTSAVVDEFIEITEELRLLGQFCLALFSQFGK
jgi:hypothetical protein